MKPDPGVRHDGPFEGGAFHPDLPGAGVSGSIQITHDGGVQFRSPSGNVALPLTGLTFHLGGDNDRLVFFAHPAQPKTTIHTADHRVLAHPLIASNPVLAVQASRARHKRHAAPAVLLSCAVLLIAAIVLLVLSKDRLVSVIADNVPVTWEIQAGDTLFAQVIANKRIIKDPALLAQLQQLTDPLVNGIDDKRYPLRFHIVEDATLNAFALPGGNAVIHTGLLLAADTPEEVAGVLAHEIAHITRRHSIHRIISSAGLYLVVSYFIGDISGILGVLADNSAFLLERKFTRDFESDADDVAWGYLVRSRIDPRDMITFFRKMQAEEQKLSKTSPVSGVENALSVLSTHPATTERIAALETKLKKTAPDGFAPLPVDYSAFKQSLRALLPAVEATAK